MAILTDNQYYRERVRNLAEDLVRETAYHLVKLQNDPDCPKDEAYSRSHGLYKHACYLLRIAAPDTAEEFIQRTYNPSR